MRTQVIGRRVRVAVLGVMAGTAVLLAPAVVLTAPQLGGSQLAIDFAIDRDTAKKALVSASAVVFGVAETSDDVIGGYIETLLKPPYSMGAQFAEGLKFSDAVTFLKQWLLKDAPQSNQIRKVMIEKTYIEVFGRGATPAEYLSSDTLIKKDKAWYAPLVLQHVKYLNTHKDERLATIQRVYQAAMGRPATDVDLAYWTPRVEHYRLIVAASRTWLYSEKGMPDLLATVTRSLAKKNGKPPNDQEIKAELTKISGSTKKPIFEEM